MFRVKIRTKVYPTEDIEILKYTIGKIYNFKEYNITKEDEEGNKILYATSDDPEILSFFFEQIRKQRTVETVRRIALERMDIDKNKLILWFHKQALTQGYLAICTSKKDSPLDPIELEIEAPHIEALVNYLIPHTEKGRVIEYKHSLEEILRTDFIVDNENEHAKEE